jgi:hypothetical protein
MPHLEANDPHWQQRWWLEKVVRFLRGGEGLRAGENPDEWLKLPPEQIVSKLQSDLRFGDMALDFNMYFLGFKADRVKPGKTYDQSAYSFSSAILSARELMNNGDYFKLFDLETPLFMPPVNVLNRQSDENQLKNLDLFRKRYQAFLAKGQAAVDFAKSDPSATLATACSLAQSSVDGFVPIVLMGVPLEFLVDVMTQGPGWYSMMYSDCYTPNTPVAKLATDLESIQERNAKLFAKLEFYADDNYKPDSLMAIQPFDLSTLGIERRWISWGRVQRMALTNSSTNMDRKRAAYVLKRFFCDDLTPVGIEDGGDHTGGIHGTQPSCRACHYKLDPMAGFFRNYGNKFRDFSSNNFITFDDGAKANLQEYMSAWKMDPGANREWNIGYVRSVSDESLNDYGSTLEDLHNDFRRAPEVKSCLVKRMFEYAVGDGQTMDPGYIDTVAKEFATRAATDNSAAFRWLVSQVALSGTFGQSDPDPNQCYDLRPGTNPASAPPCRVAFLLQQNCVHCHKSTSDHGSLDLKDWTAGPDGKLTFPHLDDAGHPIGLRDTLEGIITRITTNDTEQRMPSGQYMSAQDRQALYQWAEQTKNALPRKEM